MRLNQIHRQSILNRAMKAEALVEAATALEYRGNILAQEVYAFVFPVRVRIGAADAGEKWVKRRTKFKVNVAGATIELQFKEPVPLPHDEYSCCAVVESSKLADRIMAWADDVEQNKKNRERAKAAISAMLESCSTVETLASVWPEGKQFYSELEVRKPDLPTIVGTDVNKLLGVA